MSAQATSTQLVLPEQSLAPSFLLCECAQAMSIRLVLPEQYQADRKNIFPSAESLAWFIRQNREALVQNQALLNPAGRKLIDPAAFDAVVIDVGTRRAAAVVR